MNQDLGKSSQLVIQVLDRGSLKCLYGYSEKEKELLIQLYPKDFVVYKLSKFNKCEVSIRAFLPHFLSSSCMFYLQGHC